MIRCTNCSYGWNPDTATSCVQCKKHLVSAASANRSDTLDELPRKSDAVRNPTLVEGASFISQPMTPQMPPESQPMSQAAFSSEQASNHRSAPMPIDSTGGDSASRRQTVFTGAANSGEIPISSNTRRKQTVAVDPNRKIVGVLITYSWQESGQVFPVLEGRNLIGKDPDQCDICIPQDATLSAVNSFITFRKHFLIGDKVSMSGTDVDGEPIEAEFVPLRNYAKIRTGSTYWTFVSIQPPAPGVEDAGSGS